MSEEVKYCTKCFKTEADCKCGQDRYFVLLDINMVDIIRTLNEKGYQTQYCCESHPEKYRPSLYIMFSKDIRFLGKNLPKSFQLDRNGRTLKKLCMCMRDKKTGLESLLKWCISLPDISEFETDTTCMEIQIGKDTKKRVEDFIKDSPVTFSEFIRLLLIQEMENPKLDYLNLNPYKKRSSAKKTTFTVKLPKVMKDVLGELAKRKRVSISSYTAVVLEDMLEEDEVQNTRIFGPLPKGEKSLVQIKIPEDVKDEYKAIARKRNSSSSVLVTRVILKYLEGLGYTF